MDNNRDYGELTNWVTGGGGGGGDDKAANINSIIT